MKAVLWRTSVKTALTSMGRMGFTLTSALLTTSFARSGEVLQSKQCVRAHVHMHMVICWLVYVVHIRAYVALCLWSRYSNAYVV